MPISLASAAAVAGGAALGGLVRWLLTLALAPMSPPMPLGTLVANLAGGLLIGITIGLLDQFDGLPMALRLALTTGFLGGLTTFSAFAGETVTLMLRGQWGWTTLIIVAHVLGTLLATLLGVGIARLLLRA